MPPKPKAPAKKSAAREARPHKYYFGKHAHALVCLLRTDSVAAKYWCPSLVDKRGASTVDGNTNADDLVLALFHKLGGDIVRSHKHAKEKDGKNAKEAAPWKIVKRKGRPNNETAVADAAAKLVEERGEHRVQRDAAKRKRSASAPARMKPDRIHKTGKFTARGNAIVAPKATAVVEVAPLPSPPSPPSTPSPPSEAASPPSPPFCSWPSSPAGSTPTAPAEVAANRWSYTPVARCRFARYPPHPARLPPTPTPPHTCPSSPIYATSIAGRGQRSLTPSSRLRPKHTRCATPSSPPAPTCITLRWVPPQCGASSARAAAASPWRRSTRACRSTAMISRSTSR